MKMVPLMIPPSLARHAGEGAIILVVLGGVMAGGWWIYDYFTYRRPLAQVEVYVTLGDRLCETRSDSPLFIGVINNSDRTVTGMKFALDAHQPAGGGNLQSDFTYTDNNRIPPGNALGDCWPANYEAAETERTVRAHDLKWRILRHDLTFAD